jgi:tRNA modification GTPase
VTASDTAAACAAVEGDLQALLTDAARGRMIRDGATVVISGRPNVGKSSIFNRLAGSDRAIVTEVPGTTRDLVTERVDLEGVPVTLVDTAGWRETADLVEREGVARGTRARAAADLTLVVLDHSEPLTPDDEHLLAATQGGPRLVVANKGDLEVDLRSGSGFSAPDVTVSAWTGEGFDGLRGAMVRALTGGEPLRDTAAVSNARHIGLLEGALGSLVAARAAAESGDIPEEFVLTDLQAARLRLDEIVGVRTSEDVLRHIFERFCIGK